MPIIVINGQSYEAREGQKVLDVARKNSIPIPAICHHPALTPAGACKLCAVQTTNRQGNEVIRMSCLTKVRDGMDIQTETELVQQARIKAFNRLLSYAPESAVLRNLAQKFGIDLGPAPDECIRCRLCVRACREIVQADALTLEKRDGEEYVFPHPEHECIGCGTCANLCPTGAIKVEDNAGVRTISIRDQIIGQHPLMRCEACGQYFATGKFLNHVQTHTAGHPETKEHHRYCPTCAKLLSDRIKSATQMKRF
jgi:NADH dehydrogenase/NADH:ubiquinone oxidoreductase subunit G